MRMRTAVAATALAALAVLGGAGAAAAAGPDDDHASQTNLVDSNIITTWITDSFNEGISKSFNNIVVFGDLN